MGFGTFRAGDFAVERADPELPSPAGELLVVEDGPEEIQAHHLVSGVQPVPVDGSQVELDGEDAASLDEEGQGEEGRQGFPGS